MGVFDEVAEEEGGWVGGGRLELGVGFEGSEGEVLVFVGFTVRIRMNVEDVRLCL